LSFTAAQTGFSERLIEKDYFCSVALADLCTSDETEIVFKGGTCLSKVHADFFRLSEDLDFSLSTPVDSTRSQRSKRLDRFKRHFAEVSDRCDCFRIDQPLPGFNHSLQYRTRLAY
jgi:predicted nucleotidyltransferase component of viral defense system